jgi:predicted ATP-dependent serine protease
MQQSLIIKPSTIQKRLQNKENTSQTATTRFTFNISEIDALFPGFRAGDFAVLYGPKSITSLTSLFCVRAQLPTQLGGLESNVVFIDCANSSSLSNIEHIAQNQHLDAKEAIERIYNMRVYTAYRLTSIIMEKLKEAVESCNAKLVVISDIAGPFLHDNVDDQEARTVYSQIMSYLAKFAKRHHIIIIATYASIESSTRNNILQEITTAKASTVLRFTKTPYTKEVELEKHPSFMLGVADLTSENQALTDFIGTVRYHQNYFLM